MADKIDTESFKQMERLRELRVSHRDLDYLIDQLQHDPMSCEISRLVTMDRPKSPSATEDT